MADGIDFDSLAGPSGGTGADYYDLEEDATNSALIAELDRKKASRKLALPTNDLEVRRRLRGLGHPITLFGEKREDRRERLRDVIVRQRQAQGLDIDMDSGSDSDDSGEDGEGKEEEEKEEEFYTEGDEDLARARRWMAAYSLPRAKRRVARQKAEATLPLTRILEARKGVFAELKSYTSLGSQFADERPICAVRFSPNSRYILSGSWSGTVKLWDVPNCRLIEQYKGHNGERIGGLAWHPRATLPGGPSSSEVNFASSGADFNVQLWGLQGLDRDASFDAAAAQPTKPLATLSGHSHRVCKLSYHPSGRYIASASYDGTWRLWDVASTKELLLQEGHSKELYSIAFQPDEGSLVASGGLDAIGRVWDTRSGRSVMVLDGHIRDILSIDWSPATGHQLATGSNDDTVKIWDLRMLKCLYTIPAHRSTVSEVKFFKAEDGLTEFPKTIEAAKVKQEPKPNGTAHAEGTPDVVVKTEEQEDVKPDISKMDTDESEQIPVPAAAGWGRSTLAKAPISGMYLASSGYDGFVKLWSADDWQLVKSLNSEAGGKIMSVDLSQNGKFLATGEWSRTFKLFSAADIKL